MKCRVWQDDKGWWWKLGNQGEPHGPLATAAEANGALQAELLHHLRRKASQLGNRGNCRRGTR